MKKEPADFMHELQPGEQWCIYTGGHVPALVVIHPDRAPLMIFEDGGRISVQDISPAHPPRAFGDCSGSYSGTGSAYFTGRERS